MRVWWKAESVAGMGGSLSDPTVWNEENRRDLFEKTLTARIPWMIFERGPGIHLFARAQTFETPLLP